MFMSLFSFKSSPFIDSKFESIWEYYSFSAHLPHNPQGQGPWTLAGKITLENGMHFFLVVFTICWSECEHKFLSGSSSPSNQVWTKCHRSHEIWHTRCLAHTPCLKPPHERVTRKQSSFHRISANIYAASQGSVSTEKAICFSFLLREMTRCKVFRHPVPDCSAPILAFEELICCHLVALSQPATPSS